MRFARVVSHAAAMPTIESTFSGSSAGRNELSPPPALDQARKEPGNVPTHAEMSQRNFGSLNEIPGRIRIIMPTAASGRGEKLRNLRGLTASLSNLMGQRLTAMIM